MTAIRQNPQVQVPFDAELGQFSAVTTRGALKTAESQRLLGASFEGSSLDTANWTQTTALTGTVVINNTGFASVETGTNAAGSASVESNTTAEFLTGSVNHLIVAIRFNNTGVASNIRRLGVFDANNGLFFELNGTTFRIVSRKSGVDTAVANGSFVGSYGATFTLDTLFHTYEIYYSMGDAFFIIDKLLLHKLTASTTSFVAVTSLKNRYENSNTGSTANNTMEIRGTSVSRLGHIPGTPANPISVFVSGPPSTATQLIRFGRLTTSATGSFFRMEATTYTEPGSAAQRSVGSSSASDTAAGTGARTVEITYYDNTLAGPFTETITLNGTTAVNTVSTTIRFIESLKIKTVGSTGSNVGTITLFGSTAGGGGTVGTIAATDNQTFWAHHYVPVSKSAALRTFLNGVRGGNQGGGFHGRRINPLLANDVEIQTTDELRVAAGSSSVLRVYDSPIVIAGPSKFTVFVFPEGSNTLTWHSSFDIVEQ